MRQPGDRSGKLWGTMRHFPAQYDLQPDDTLYFCHIPKTAGMTFRTILEDYFACEEICPATLSNQIADYTPEQLREYRLFRGHLGFVNIPGLLAGKNLIKVTVLREPVSRVISHYEYIRRTPDDPYYESVSQMTLEEFATGEGPGRVGKNVQVYHIARLLQYDIGSLEPEEALALAQKSLHLCAYAGILERFQESLFLLSYIFGWKPIVNSRRENVAKSKTPLSEIPPETLARIREAMSLDRALYDDGCEIFQQRFDEMQQDLVQRYGDRLALDAPPPGQVLEFATLQHLLEWHSQDRYQAQNPPPSEVSVYNFCQPLRGLGWQRRDCAQNRPNVAHRWTGPVTTSTLDLPIAPTPTDYRVELQVSQVWATEPEVLDSLKCLVNGHPSDLAIAYSSDTTRLYQAQIPADWLPPDRLFAELTLQVDRVAPINHKNPDPKDKRLVGVALSYVQLFPAAREAEFSLLRSLLRDALTTATIDFVRDRLKPQEQIAAPPQFRLPFSGQVEGYADFLQSPGRYHWLVLHKGMALPVEALLFQLARCGFRPVFANEVYVVFVRRRPELPALSYFTPDVRHLYVGRYLNRLRKGVASLKRS
ncbi:Sulfotransferase family protein [Leptolyngbya sp. O-77]|nr:Sulfotransferase family protein [Leptolyngbya sp. O-77]